VKVYVVTTVVDNAPSPTVFENEEDAEDYFRTLLRASVDNLSDNDVAVYLEDGVYEERQQNGFNIYFDPEEVR
jgi:hypothetical protein